MKIIPLTLRLLEPTSKIIAEAYLDSIKNTKDGLSFDNIRRLK